MNRRFTDWQVVTLVVGSLIAVGLAVVLVKGRDEPGNVGSRALRSDAAGPEVLPAFPFARGALPSLPMLPAAPALPHMAAGDALVRFDLVRAAAAEQAYFSAHGNYTVTIDDLNRDGALTMPGVVLSLQINTVRTFCITGSFQAQPSVQWHYDSAQGDIRQGKCT